MPAVLIQDTSDGIVNRCRRRQNAAGHSFSNEYDVINQLALSLVHIYFDNMLHIPCESLLCFAKIGTLATQKSPNLVS